MRGISLTVDALLFIVRSAARIRSVSIGGFPTIQPRETSYNQTYVPRRLTQALYEWRDSAEARSLWPPLRGFGFWETDYQLKRAVS